MGNTCNSDLKFRYAEPTSDVPDGDGYSSIWRTMGVPKTGPLPAVPASGAKTGYEWFRHIVATKGSKKFLGTRQRLADGKFGKYEYMTYKEVADWADEFGSGLLELGLVPEKDFDDAYAKRLRPIGIVAKNRKEWIPVIEAAYAFNMCLVPLYETLGQEAVTFIIQQTGMSSVVVSNDSVEVVLRAHETITSGASPTAVGKGKGWTLKNIISMEGLDAEKAKRAASIGLHVFSFEEVVEAGKSHPHKHTPCQPSDVNTICYTSGTTGTPKGVILTHGNLAASTAAIMYAAQVVNKLEIGASDVHISYLPFAHVFERMIFEVMAYSGAQIGFYTGDALKLLDDIRELKPTIFVSVPRMYNRIYEKIQAQAASSGFVKQWIFKAAVDAKLAQLRQTGETKHSLWDSLVFSKTQQLMGGRVRFMITGSAPISPTVHEFIKIAMCCPVIEGYGMTETACSGTLSSVFDSSVGHVGGPKRSIEFKLKAVPELGYLPTDVDEAGAPMPRGEILLRGPSIFPGYFLAKDKTIEVLDSDGWLHTGDVAVIRPNGSLKILDRAKNIFKLAQGEYVAPEKIENVYIQAPGVGQVFVFGYSTKSVLVGIVVPSFDFVKTWAAKNNKSSDLKEACKDESLKKDIFKHMEVAAKSEGLNGVERVKAIYLHDEPFSVENDLITPTFKLKRHVAKKVFKTQIDALYEEVEKNTPLEKK